MADGLREKVASNGDEGQLLVKIYDEILNLGRSVSDVKTDVAVVRTSQAGCVKLQDDRWSDHKEEHRELNRRSNLLDGMIGLGTIVGAWLGISR